MPPVKILHQSTKKKIGVVVDSLKALKAKAKEKFELIEDSDSLVVKLKDGTVVDDEEYFSCMEKDTCYVIISTTETQDVVDGVIPNGISVSDPSLTDISRLVAFLQSDITNVVKLNEQQLELVREANEVDLKVRLHLTIEEIEGLQEACHMHQIERQKTTDAVELLKIYKHHLGSALPAGAPSKKAKI